MSEADHQQAAKEPQAMGQIVGYLKNYPFLLITIAGLLILSGILIYDNEKLKEFKTLVYAVVLVPLVFQFFIEYQKMRFGRKHSAAPVTVNVQQPTSGAPLPLSRKAWISVIICIFLFLSLGVSPDELNNKDTATGFLVLALLAAGLAFAANADANRRIAGSKGVAITGIVLSTLMALSAIGSLGKEESTAPVSSTTPQSDSASPATPTNSLPQPATPRTNR